ncbi:serine/threonine-protein kinase WNK2-like [Anopheles maculipalpis]|uniref:serine/threonine-protein kinase WNK2-like n=1 Tax=Anopheles maculipalpis TaxID=1496333 RepID=UPI0021596369|nr:serine/threonine-protein kinase WNK2-like [Anopheles maculipalpis]
MFQLNVLLVGIVLPFSVLSAPTVHLQDHFPDPTVTEDYNAVPAVTEAPQLLGKPHVVEPTWITVTMPPQSYTPTGIEPKPHVMPPYTTYIPVPPLQQPMPVAQWPLYYPNMPVLPYPYASNHLCNQQMSSYRVV